MSTETASLTAVVKKVHRYCGASGYSEIFLKTVSVPFNLIRTLQDRNTEVTVSRRGTAVSFKSKHLLVRLAVRYWLSEKDLRRILS